jgi:glycosyltransferase involved in cell wall biosynthesis
LDDTLDSIIKQKRFFEYNDVEVVVSDNCSEDDTKETVGKYIKLFGNRIRYFRNKENIGAKNIHKVLTYGDGLYLKLNNDTLIHQEDTLNNILKTVINYSKNKEVLFFSNFTLNNVIISRYSDLNEFIKKASFYSTWIACFGLWKSDINNIKNFDTIHESLLINEVLFELITKKSAVIDNSKLFNAVSPSTKGGYNLYKIFVSNYIGLLEKYRKNNEISKYTLFNEKTKLFLYFLVPWTLNLKDNKSRYFFDDEKALSIVFKKYAFHPVFYIGSFYFILRFFYRSCKKKN